MDQPNGTQDENQPINEPSFNEQESTVGTTPATPAEPVNTTTTEPATVDSSANNAWQNPSSDANTPPVAAFTPISQQSPVIPGAQPAKKSGKKWLPLAIAGGALLLLGGGASAYYFGVHQNPDKVIYDAYTNLVTAKHVQLKGDVTIDMESMMGIKLKKISYDTKADSAPGAELDLKAEVVVMSSDLTVGGKGMFADNGDLYFQLNGLKDSMQTIMKTAGSSSELPAEYFTALEKLENQWVKVTNEDLKKDNEDYAKAQQCVIDVAKKYKDSDNKEFVEAYKNNSFIQKKEDLGYKDGNVGYKLNFDEAKFKSFSKAIEDTPYMKDVQNCAKDVEEGSSTSPSSDSTDKPKVDDDSSVSVWIDQWNHKLKKVEYTTGGQSGDYKLEAKGVANIGYDESIKVQAPSDTITFEEFTKRVEDLSSKLGIPASSFEPADGVTVNSFETEL